MLRKVLFVGATLLLATGCTEDAMPGAIEDAEACQSAVNDVAEEVEGQAAPEDLEPVFDACRSMEDFSEFVQEDGLELIGDMNADEFVTEQCNSMETLAETELCQSL